MKIEHIPKEVVKAARARDFKLKLELPWWRVAWCNIPAQAVLARSTGNGCWKVGVECWLIKNHSRKVYPDKLLSAAMIPEYTALTALGEQRLVQIPRDVEMINEDE